MEYYGDRLEVFQVVPDGEPKASVSDLGGPDIVDNNVICVGAPRGTTMRPDTLYTVNISNSHVAGALGLYLQHTYVDIALNPPLDSMVLAIEAVIDQGKSGKDYVAKDNLTEERGERGFTPSKRASLEVMHIGNPFQSKCG